MIAALDVATTTVGLPIWAMLLGVLLTGGTSVAIIQFMAQRSLSKSKRAETRATSELAESVANLNDVNALRSIIDGVSLENERLRTKMMALETRTEGLEILLARKAEEVDSLKAELGKRPTRQELFDENGRLRRQLLDEGITPSNGLMNRLP